VDGCVLEGGPDSFLSAKPAAAELIRELGLGADLIGSNDASRVTYVVKGGRLRPLPDGLMMMVPTKLWPMVLSPLLSWSTKLRMGLELLRRPPAEEMPDRTVSEFIRDHYGQETVDYLAEPLLSGVYGGSVDRLSVNSVLTRFVEIEKQHGSLTRGVLEARAKSAGRSKGAEPLFLTLKGGLQQLTEALEREVRPAADVLQAEALAVSRTPEGWNIHLRQETVAAERVILATPAWRAGALLRDVHQKLSILLEGIEYSSSVTLALGYRKDRAGAVPRGFGFLVPAAERKTLVACTFIGAKFQHRVPESHIVLRCFLGGAGREGVLDLEDSRMVAIVREELKQLLGWDAEPDFVKIRRWRRAMAQYAVGHGARMQRIADLLPECPGLALAGNAYEGIGISDCVRTGRAAAKRSLEQ
jgi:oxygen-dependent protoporphyrinogen oxidase